MEKRACIITSYSMPMNAIPSNWANVFQNDGTLDTGVVFSENDHLWMVLTEGTCKYVMAVHLRALNLITLTSDCFSGEGKYAHFNSSEQIYLDDNPNGSFGIIIQDNKIDNHNSKMMRITY